jgi:trk system potassium uptake protein
MKIIIVGSGRVGAVLARDLDRLGHQVWIIDRDRDAFARIGANFSGRRVEGVAFDRETLERAGIDKADAFAACTSSDNANLLAARIARDVYQVPVVVARLYDPDQQTLYERMGIQTVCTSLWGAEQMVSLICHPEWDVVASVGNGDVQIVQVRVGEDLAGYSAARLSKDEAVVVVGVMRGTRTMLASADLVLEVGDLLFLAVDVNERDQIWKRVHGDSPEAEA